MSEGTGFCLRGQQVNPKPRPKDWHEKTLSKTTKTNGRPYSASHVYKSLESKRLEKTTRPKSANDISSNEKRNLNRQSRLVAHSKATSRYYKSAKCSEITELNASEAQIKNSLQISNSTLIRSAIKNDDNFYNLEEREILCSPPSYVCDRNHFTYLVSTKKSLPDDFNFEKPHLKKQLNPEDYPFDSLHKHSDNGGGYVPSNSPNVTSTDQVTKREIEALDHEKCSVLTDSIAKAVVEDEELDMNSPKTSCIVRESVVENSIDSGKFDTAENNLISLLVDLENDMISTCHDNLQDGLKSSMKANSPNSVMNHPLSLLDDDFPTLNLEIENEIKLFKVLCNIAPHKENKNGISKDDVKECNITSNSSNLLADDIIEETSAEITSQIKEVDKILKASREHLHEDIIDILSIHDNNSQLINGCKVVESAKLIAERPSCVGGSLECWRKTTETGEEGDNQTNSPNGKTSCIDNFHGDTPDSDLLVTSDVMTSCISHIETPDIPVYSIASKIGNKIIDDYHEEQEKSRIYCRMESSGNFKNDQSSDEDSTYEDILTTLKVLEKEEREPVLLSSRPPPTGSEFEHTPRVKLKELLSFLDDVDQSCSSPLKSVVDDLRIPNSENFTTSSVQGKRSNKFIEHSDPSDLVSCNQLQEMRLQEQAKGLALLKKELDKTREKSAKEKVKLRKMLEDEHAKIVMRHQEFIEKLLAEKKAINEKCEALILKLQKTEESHKATISAMEEHHAIELRNEHERVRLDLRATRDRWIREKTQKIQTATAKGAEGEVKRLVSEQSYQIEALWKARLDELRGRLEREAEEGMAKERDLARKRLEERMEEMERFHQEERRKFLAEECVLRGRAEEAERRARGVEDEARKRRTEDLSAERARAQANLEKTTDEIEKNYQIVLSKEKAQREIVAEAARKEEREMMEVEQKKREAKLKEQLRLERDRGIEKAVLHLTRQAEKTQQEMEARTEMTLRRMRERCDEQVQIAETDAEKERKQGAEIRSQSAVLVEENSSLKMSLSRLEKELETAHKLTTSLYEERSQIRELVVEEWSARVAALREEVGILKAQVIGEKERREMELAQLQKEREQELVQVQKRVEIAIAKKEETVNQLKSMYEAALKKCSQLQELLDKQRKDLLLK